MVREALWTTLWCITNNRAFFFTSYVRASLSLFFSRPPSHSPDKLTSGTRESLCIPGSPGQSQAPPSGAGASGMGSRRGSLSSLSSVTSMLEEKDDEKIRCCHHCMDTLLKRQQKLEERDHMPDIVKLYEVRRSKVQAVRAKAFLI